MVIPAGETAGKKKMLPTTTTIFVIGIFINHSSVANKAKKDSLQQGLEIMSSGIQLSNLPLSRLDSFVISFVHF